MMVAATQNKSRGRINTAVTMRDVAVHAGVSRQTVSGVLGGNAHLFNEQTRQRVLDAVQALGYRPNASAQAIRKGRFDTIALLLSTQLGHSNLPVTLLTGIHEGLTEQGQHLMVTQLPDSTLADPEFAPKVLQQTMADGLLINYTHAIPETLLLQIREHIVPSIWINSQQESDCVYPDDFGAGIAATEHLLALGHRRIAYVDFVPRTAEIGHYSVGDRYRGYCRALESAGLIPRRLNTPEICTLEERTRQRVAWLTAPDRPTALLAYSSISLLPFVHLAPQLGLRVPGDLSLLSFTDLQEFADGETPISGWRTPGEAMGRAAVEMLLQKIDQPDIPVPPRSLPFVYQEGNTCGSLY